MKAEITMLQLWDNPSVRGFFLREQSEDTLQELVDRSEHGVLSVLGAIEDECEFEDISLDKVEEDLYNLSVEEFARKYDIDLDEDEDEEERCL